VSLYPAASSWFVGRRSIRPCITGLGSSISESFCSYYDRRSCPNRSCIGLCWKKARSSGGLRSPSYCTRVACFWRHCARCSIPDSPSGRRTSDSFSHCRWLTAQRHCFPAMTFLRTATKMRFSILRFSNSNSHCDHR